jgi:hypothetical protein
MGQESSWWIFHLDRVFPGVSSAGTGIILGYGPLGQKSSWRIVYGDRSPPGEWPTGTEFLLGYSTVHWDRSSPWATRTGVLPVDFPLGQDLSWGMLHWDSPLVQEYLGVWSTGTEVLLGYRQLVQELSWVMVQCDRSPPGVWSTCIGVINVIEVLLGVVHWYRSYPGYGPLVQKLSWGLVHLYRSSPGVWSIGSGVILESGPMA